MTEQNRPPLVRNDKHLGRIDDSWMRACEAQREADIKWFNKWLEEQEASGKVKCPDCEWSQFGDEPVGMTPCYSCNSTGYLTEPLRLND
ncbi:hypothetical protein LCGC14_1342640 [marine sediment metagenome]|uniref:Uncharacterized protein n=1 Tax=marine sediment metagenome TaxID=412755 RepID=A0A0F9NFK1_9ZZZZ